MFKFNPLSGQFDLTTPEPDLSATYFALNGSNSQLLNEGIPNSVSLRTISNDSPPGLSIIRYRASGADVQVADSLGGISIWGAVDGQLRNCASIYTEVTSVSGTGRADLIFGVKNSAGGSVEEKLRIVSATTAIALFNCNIGVKGSAAATVPGTVVKKLEIFDETGASLGFIAIYDAIV